MSDGNSNLKPCKDEVFQNGEKVCIIDGKSGAVEKWVRHIAEEAMAEIDWHYSCGRAVVLHLGDDDSRERVLDAIEKFRLHLDGRILDLSIHG